MDSKFIGSIVAMKKILGYTLAAVLLGIVTMVAPFALFVGETNTQAGLYPPSPEFMRDAPSKLEETYGITAATHSADIMFIVFMSVLSFVMALGVMSYFKRKAFTSSSS
jgi:hypothetical protein